ncbi:MAG TPA: hypothetical protein VEJ63_02105 [Planctomycetota bacterium]|nr:hypothetical protein [Planctomycetota bacterium]
MKIGLRVSGLFGLLALCACLSVRAEDKLILIKNNQVISGRIVKEDIENIQIELKGQGSVSYKPSEVLDIEWGITDPIDFRDGYNSFKKGAYGRAADTFGGLLKDEESMKTFPPQAKAYLNYIYAESLYRAEKPQDAMAAFEKFMNEFKTSSFTTAAVGSMVDCAIMTGDFGKVPALLGQLRQQGGEQGAQADYLEGKMLLAQKKPKDADQRFSKAAAAATTASTRGLALMGQARVAVANADLTKARDLAQKALTANPPRVVAAEAHLVIGDAIVAEVDAKKPTGDELVNAYLDALLAYLRVPLLYDGDRATEPRAMYQAGDVLKRMSKLPNRGADRIRAITVFTKLTQDGRYRGTEYAAKAAEALKTFR